MEPIAINARPVGPDAPVYVIAEAGMNHNGDMDLARQMIVAAAGAGADAIKFQSFRTDRLVTPAAPDRAFRKSVELTPAQHELLIEACAAAGIDFLSTPCDEGGVTLLYSLGVGALKIGSFDITHEPLLECAAATGLPILLSVGTATLKEIDAALAALCRGQADAQVVLLHCVSQYPADEATVNLASLATLRDRYGLPVGYSDHTLGTHVAPLAVACGACVIEKHFTLDRALPGPDQAISCEPGPLAEIVHAVRAAHAALGLPGKQPLAPEIALADIARRSVHAITPIPAGSRITRTMLEVLRPPTGLPPADLPRLLGKTARVDIPAFTPLQWEMIHQVEEGA